MRSQLIQSASLEKQIRSWPWQREDADGQAQEAVYQICLKYKHYSHPETIGIGDIVRIKLQGPAPRFARAAWITVGSGMFDKELETLLVGLPSGGSGVLAHSAGPIPYQILDAQRLIVPALDDAIAAGEHIEGITSADQLYGQLKLNALKEILYNQVFDFLKSYSQLCTFRIDADEVEEMVQAELTRCRGISREMGMVFDEMSREELLGAVGQPDIPSFCNMVRGFSADILRRALLNCEKEHMDSSAVTLSQVPNCSYQYLLYVRDQAVNYA